MEASELNWLIQRLKAGDETALQLLMEDFGPKLLAYLGKFFTDWRDAEEVCNDVWLEVWTTAHQYDERMSFKRWLYNKARWRATDRLRQQEKEEIVLVGLGAELAAAQAGARSPGGSEARARQLEHVRRALAELSPEDRFLVEAYIAGITSSDIAEQLGVKPNTVRMRFKRILSRFRKGLSHAEEHLERQDQVRRRP